MTRDEVYLLTHLTRYKNRVLQLHTLTHICHLCSTNQFWIMFFDFSISPILSSVIM